ncbi:MAG: O-antigen ligase family protein [Aeromicrobium sp.]
MRPRLDAVHVLTLVLVLLVALPSRLTFAPLGGAGAPALIMGLGCFAWWAYHRAQRVTIVSSATRPMPTALFVVMACFLASYVVAMTRAIDPDESRTADIGIMLLVSWAGILLLAHDGTPSRERLDVLVRRVIFAGGAVATLGVIQFVTGQVWIDHVSIPGLSVNTSMGGVFERDGFNRPAGTAIHPIEFGAVITMIFPLALNSALTDRARGVVRRWYPVLAIGLAVMLSISRSTIVSAVVAVLVVAVAWTPTIRWRAALIGTFFLGVVFLAVPGLFGTLKGLFTGLGDDASAQSRTGSYAIASEFIERSPVFGRGFSTFLPKYRILDNQYLGLVIEVGVAGLLAVLWLFLVGAVLARRVRLTARDEPTRQMAQSLAAAISAGAVGLAFYDGFSFPMATGVLFLMLGLAGGLHRLQHDGSMVHRGRYDAEQLSSDGRLLGRSSASTAARLSRLPRSARDVSPSTARQK